MFLAAKWVRPSAVTTDRDGITFVDLDEPAYRDEPFVLAKDVLPVFYATDNAHEGKHVVLQGKRKIVGVEDVMDKNGYKGYEEIAPFGQDVDLTIFEEGEEAAYVRRDHDEAIIVN